jgi:hypothetical protein
MSLLLHGLARDPHRENATPPTKGETMRFEDKIRCLAVLYDFSVTSWIRTRKHNKFIGGVTDSRHLLGLAVDVVLDEMEREVGPFTVSSKQLGLQVILEGDHIHLQEPRE